MNMAEAGRLRTLEALVAELRKAVAELQVRAERPTLKLPEKKDAGR